MAAAVSVIEEHRVHAIPSLAARRARELAEIHDATCRWKRQNARCSICSDMQERAARLERQP